MAAPGVLLASAATGVHHGRSASKAMLAISGHLLRWLRPAAPTLSLEAACDPSSTRSAQTSYLLTRTRGDVLEVASIAAGRIVLDAQRAAATTLSLIPPTGRTSAREAVDLAGHRDHCAPCAVSSDNNDKDVPCARTRVLRGPAPVVDHGRTSRPGRSRRSAWPLTSPPPPARSPSADIPGCPGRSACHVTGMAVLARGRYRRRPGSAEESHEQQPGLL